MLNFIIIVLALVLCCDSKINIFVGTAPFCNTNNNSCNVYNMKFDGLVKLDCWSGHKAICDLQPKFSHGDQDPHKLNLLTYNIFARPYTVTHDGQKERLCRIPEVIAANVPETDVIIINEGFITSCYKDISIRKLAVFYGWPYATKTVGSSGFHGLENGGVFILSRWPIEKSSEHIFKATNYRTSDALAAKGVSYAQINKLGQKYHIFGTHLQAEDGTKSDEVRLKQMHEMRTFIESKVHGSRDRVLFGGDLNMDYHRNEAVFKRAMDIIKSEITPIRLDPLVNARKLESMEYTYDGKNNSLVEYPEYPQSWFDYVGLVQGYAYARSKRMDALRLVTPKAYEYCASAKVQPWWVSPRTFLCSKVKSSHDLSDHFPVLGRFEF